MCAKTTVKAIQVSSCPGPTEQLLTQQKHIQIYLNNAGVGWGEKCEEQPKSLTGGISTSEIQPPRRLRDL